MYSSAHMFEQQTLFETPATTASQQRVARSGSFVDNMKLPVHRWYRYSAGFSAQWVESVLRDTGARRLIDPFAGSGTTLLAADALGVEAVGVEAHPFVARIGAAKLSWRAADATLVKAVTALTAYARAHVLRPQTPPAELLAKCFEPQALDALLRLRTAYTVLAGQWGNDVSQLIFMLLTSILRECSFVGTAQWQYVLPNQRKQRVLDPAVSLQRRLAQMIEDRAAFVGAGRGSSAHLVQGDARELEQHVCGPFDLMLTSPPYPNNYDYADATRLEQTFWGEVDSWSDLHAAVRQYLVRSSSQHTAKERLQLDTLLAAPELEVIREPISRVCTELSSLRESRGGKKTYHTMIAAYFVDMARTMNAARAVMGPGSTVCWVIGDSAPYGVHVPADAWLAQLAETAGFSQPRFEKLRDRNIKWKNRKHTVPLLEGRLWLRG